MDFQTVSVVLHSLDKAPEAIESAIEVTRNLNARLRVYALGIDHLETQYQYAAIEAMAVTESRERALQDAENLGHFARARLEKEDFSWDVREAALQMGALRQGIARMTRFDDLFISNRPYGGGRGALDVRIVEAALFDAGRPVLIIPPDVKTPHFDQRMMLAWDDGDQALRAARTSLPLLDKASLVQIAIVDPPAHAPDRSDPGGAIAQFLTRHGVRCDIAVLAKTTPDVASTLLGKATEKGAELLVMGAYGHSRLREAIFGGTTRHILEHATIPVLLAH